jgi:hypothetical protein
MPAGGGIGVRILLVRCGTRILGRQFAAAEKGGAGSPAGAPRGFCCLCLLLSVAAVVCGCCICRGCCGSETLAASTLGGQHPFWQAPFFARGDSSIGRCFKSTYGMTGLSCGGLIEERRRQQHGPSWLRQQLAPCARPCLVFGTDAAAIGPLWSAWASMHEISALESPHGRSNAGLSGARQTAL